MTLTQQFVTIGVCVLGTMLIVAIQSLTLPQAIGFALGSGGGYYLAVVLVAEGQRRLRTRQDIPD